MENTQTSPENDVRGVYLFYSRYSKHCQTVFLESKKLPFIKPVLIDHPVIRKKVMSSKKLPIQNVPTLVIVYKNGQALVWEGEKATDWVSEQLRQQTVENQHDQFTPDSYQQQPPQQYPPQQYPPPQQYQQPPPQQYRPAPSPIIQPSQPTARMNPNIQQYPPHPDPEQKYPPQLNYPTQSQDPNVSSVDQLPEDYEEDEDDEEDEQEEDGQYMRQPHISQTGGDDEDAEERKRLNLIEQMKASLGEAAGRSDGPKATQFKNIKNTAQQMASERDGADGPKQPKMTITEKTLAKMESKSQKARQPPITTEQRTKSGIDKSLMMAGPEGRDDNPPQAPQQQSGKKPKKRIMQIQ